MNESSQLWYVLRKLENNQFGSVFGVYPQEQKNRFRRNDKCVDYSIT